MKKTNLELMKELKTKLVDIRVNHTNFIAMIGITNNYKQAVGSKEYTTTMIETCASYAENLSRAHNALSEGYNIEGLMDIPGKGDVPFSIEDCKFIMEDIGDMDISCAVEIGHLLAELIGRGMTGYTIFNSPVFIRKPELFVKVVFIAGASMSVIKSYNESDISVGRYAVEVKRNEYESYYDEFEMTEGVNVFTGMGSAFNGASNREEFKKVAEFTEDTVTLHVVDFSSKFKIANGSSHTYFRPFASYAIRKYVGEQRDSEEFYNFIIGDSVKDDELISRYNDAYEMAGKGYPMYVIQTIHKDILYTAALTMSVSDPKMIHVTTHIDFDDPKLVPNAAYVEHLSNILSYYVHKMCLFIDGGENSEVEMEIVNSKGKSVIRDNKSNGKRNYKEQAVIVKGHVRRYKSGVSTMVYPHLRKYGQEEISNGIKRIKIKI